MVEEEREGAVPREAPALGDFRLRLTTRLLCLILQCTSSTSILLFCCSSSLFLPSKNTGAGRRSTPTDRLSVSSFSTTLHSNSLFYFSSVLLLFLQFLYLNLLQASSFRFFSFNDKL